ncbi:MAG: hypothetical protein QG661_825 [Actinomycetota bacterium]|nr:hypothetical protein [Actinomycetota bacterium]
MTAVALAGALAVSACGRDQPPQVGTATIAVADREALPPVAGTTLEGTSLDLADLRGRVVVLNSWASWCSPCRDEIPDFVALADASDPADVAVVGLNVSDAPSAAEAFADELSMAYPSIVDADGALLRTIPGVPPSALPSTVIIDREGRVAVSIVGQADPQTLPDLVAQVVAEP